MTHAVEVVAVLVGRAVPFGRSDALSAIDKRPVEARVKVGHYGLDGDEQGDRRHHGGPGKAVHHYALDHYEARRRKIPSPPAVLASLGAFGENPPTFGLTKDDVCIGDVYRIGTATLQVSQARKPCWKLNHRFGVKDMARRVRASGRTGWCSRVLELGAFAEGGTLALLARSHPGWPLSRIARPQGTCRHRRSLAARFVLVSARAAAPGERQGGGLGGSPRREGGRWRSMTDPGDGPWT